MTCRLKRLSGHEKRQETWPSGLARAPHRTRDQF